MFQVVRPCACICLEKFVSTIFYRPLVKISSNLQYFIDHLWKFHQIHHFRCTWDELNCLDFEVKRSKVKVTTRQNVVRNPLFGLILLVTREQ